MAGTECLNSLGSFLYNSIAFDDGSGADVTQMGLVRAREMRREHRDELVKRYGDEVTQFYERNQLRGGVLGAVALNIDALGRIVSRYGTKSLGTYLERSAEWLRRMTSNSNYDETKPKGEKHFDEMTLAEKLMIVYMYEDKIADIFARIQRVKPFKQTMPSRQRSGMVFAYA